MYNCALLSSSSLVSFCFAAFSSASFFSFFAASNSSYDLSSLSLSGFWPNPNQVSLGCFFLSDMLRIATSSSCFFFSFFAASIFSSSFFFFAAFSSAKLFVRFEFLVLERLLLLLCCIKLFVRFEFLVLERLLAEPKPGA